MDVVEVQSALVVPSEHALHGAPRDSGGSGDGLERSTGNGATEALWERHGVSLPETPAMRIRADVQP